jgi:hypothetical protein
MCLLKSQTHTDWVRLFTCLHSGFKVLDNEMSLVGRTLILNCCDYCDARMHACMEWSPLAWEDNMKGDMRD